MCYKTYHSPILEDLNTSGRQLIHIPFRDDRSSGCLRKEEDAQQIFSTSQIQRFVLLFSLLTGLRHAYNDEGCHFLLLIEAVGVTSIIDMHHFISIDIDTSVAELDIDLLPHHSSFHKLSQE